MLKAINNFQNLSALIQMLVYDTLPWMTLYKEIRHLLADHKMPGKILGIRGQSISTYEVCGFGMGLTRFLKCLHLADSGFFKNFLYQGGAKSTVSWVFEDLNALTLLFYQIEPLKNGASLILPSNIARNS